MAMLVTAFVCLWIRDAPPPDDAWMRPVWKQDTNPPSNGLALFQNWLSKNPLPENDARFKLGTPGEPWNQAAGEALLTDFSAHLAEFDKLMGTDPTAWQWAEGPGVARLDLPVKYLNSMNALGRLLVVRARCAASPAEALQQSRHLMRFGSGTAGARGPLIHHLVATTIYVVGLNSVKTAVTDARATPADLDAAARILRETPVRPRDTADTLRTEFECFRRLIDGVAAGSTAPTAMGMPGQARWLLKRNRTLQTYQDWTGPMIRTLDAGWAGLGATMDHHDADLKGLSKHRLRHMFQEGAGAVLLSLAAPVASTIGRMAANAEAQRVNSLVHMALRQQELKAGTLPPSLTGLVPPDLLDPWSQKSPRWNPATQIVYSAGKNGLDEGGDVTRTKPNMAPDYGEEYWWKKAP